MIKNRIGLCMIVKDETEYLENCLKSVKDLVDKIIIVMTDKDAIDTKNIVEKYADYHITIEWKDDFSLARNASFRLGAIQDVDYLMWLDADDVILPEHRPRFLEVKEYIGRSQVKSVSMNYRYSFDSEGNPSLVLRRTRLIRKDEYDKDGQYWKGVVHEYLDTSLEEGYKSEIIITHNRVHSNGNRNLKIFQNMKPEDFTTRDILYYAKELYYNGRYNTAISKFNEYLNKDDKWVEDVIDAKIKLFDCYDKIGECRIDILISTFEDSFIRAEVLYTLGSYYMKLKNYKTAIYFFKQIIPLNYPTNCSGFLNEGMWTWKPILELVVCYWYIGDINRAEIYHKMSKELIPYHESVIYNDKYFLTKE